MEPAIEPQADEHIHNVQKRNQYLKKMQISVKSIEKTSNKEQLIVITTTRKDTQQVVVMNVRKLKQLDHLVQHINNHYGGHLIPFIKSDLYFQQNIHMQKLTPIIQQYLNDIKTHFHCQKDIKFYEFIFYQYVYFPSEIYYQKVLLNAADLSKKYLNTFFARKQIAHQGGAMEEFEQAYKKTQDFFKDFNPIKKISLNYLEQHQTYQQFIGHLSQLSGTLGKSLYPIQKTAWKIKQKIIKMNKYLAQIEEAKARIDILNETVRQLQGNIYKGLHEDKKALEFNEALLLRWRKSLTSQFNEFLVRAVEVSQKIASQIYELKKSEFVEHSENFQQNQEQLS